MPYICAIAFCLLLLDGMHLAFTFTVLTPWQMVPRLLLAGFIGVAGTISVLGR